MGSRSQNVHGNFPSIKNTRIMPEHMLMAAAIDMRVGNRAQRRAAASKLRHHNAEMNHPGQCTDWAVPPPHRFLET